MAFNLRIPRPDGTELKISLEIGESIFILGPNGAGKSSLVHQFYVSNSTNARRILAHRQTWIQSSANSLSASQVRDIDNNILNSDTNDDARWKDNYGPHRGVLSLYRLIEATNQRARAIAQAFEADDIPLAKRISAAGSPFAVLNGLLARANIPITLSVSNDADILAAKSGGAQYSVAQLSDGERNAVLMAATVLTAPLHSLLLIDEPERHLHRSIISPLLTSLFAERSDCAFVVSTHDVMLPLDHSDAQTLLVRGCTYTTTFISSWDVDLVPSGSPIEDNLKKDILGSRQTVLFVEGDDRSLDKALYTLVFPEASIIPKESCRDVEYATKGVRAASGFHWLRAFGIVDSDRRTEADVDALKKRGIYSLSVYSVESIYYHPELQHRIAVRQQQLTGEDAEQGLAAAHQCLLTAIGQNATRLCARAAEKAIRREVERRLPKQEEIRARNPIDIHIDVAEILDKEAQKMKQLISHRDLTGLISRYPVRETSGLSDASKALGFQGRTQYENAVRKLLADDPTALAYVRSLFGTLNEDMAKP